MQWQIYSALKWRAAADGLGRIIIKHESSIYVVQGGLFEVEVTAKQGSDVSYSVTVRGRLGAL